MPKEQKFYKIGEISKLFEIGVDSIRYYEEIGILKPIRNPENNYRLYTMEDLRKLTMIREMLALRFSTEEIKKFDETRTVTATLSLFEKELHLINDQIVNLLQQKNNIQARLSSIHDALEKKDENDVKLLDLYERPCIMVSNTNIPDEHVTLNLIEYMHIYPQRVDTIGICDCYTLDLEGSDPNSEYYRTKNVFFYSKNSTYQSNYMLPAGKYLSLIYTGSLNKTKLELPKLYAYAKEHNLTPNGLPIEFCHVDDYETNDESEFITELQLPVL